MFSRIEPRLGNLLPSVSSVFSVAACLQSEKGTPCPLPGNQIQSTKNEIPAAT